VFICVDKKKELIIMQSIPNPPTDGNSFLLWVSSVTVLGIISLFVWIARRVYPEWIKQQEQLEQYRVKAITDVCEETSKFISQHAQEEIKLIKQVNEEFKESKEAYIATLEKLNKIENQLTKIVETKALHDEIDFLKRLIEKNEPSK